MMDSHPRGLTLFNRPTGLVGLVLTRCRGAERAITELLDALRRRAEKAQRATYARGPVADLRLAEDRRDDGAGDEQSLGACFATSFGTACRADLGGLSSSTVKAFRT